MFGQLIEVNRQLIEVNSPLTATNRGELYPHRQLIEVSGCWRGGYVDKCGLERPFGWKAAHIGHKKGNFLRCFDEASPPNRQGGALAAAAFEPERQLFKVSCCPLILTTRIGPIGGGGKGNYLR